jgi:hypothetical protein
VAGSCECGNEPSGSIKRGEVLDYRTYMDVENCIPLTPNLITRNLR